MYQKQKQDALDFWKLQNDYNSPQAQMARYQEAGLNPHLIYGQSNTSSPVQAPNFQAPVRRSPEWGNAVSGAGLATLSAIYDLDIKQAQLDNLKAQNSVIREDALLRQAQTFATRTSGEKSKFGLEFETELRDTSAEVRREQPCHKIRLGTKKKSVVTLTRCMTGLTRGKNRSIFSTLIVKRSPGIASITQVGTNCPILKESLKSWLKSNVLDFTLGRSTELKIFFIQMKKRR